MTDRATMRRACRSGTIVAVVVLATLVTAGCVGEQAAAPGPEPRPEPRYPFHHAETAVARR